MFIYFPKLFIIFQLFTAPVDNFFPSSVQNIVPFRIHFWFLVHFQFYIHFRHLYYFACFRFLDSKKCLWSVTCGITLVVLCQRRWVQ
jgi:hypothetical protein